jgi:uncharacterized protein YbaP (TraB family)
MQKFVQTIFLACLTSLLLLTHVAQAATPRGLLWEVSKRGVMPSYLFGTIHSEDERVLKIPRVVKKHLHYADSFALEVIIDDAATQLFTQAMFLPEPQTLQSLLAPEEFATLLEAAKTYHIPKEKLNRLKPWAMMAVLNIPPQTTGVFLDKALLEDARAQNKQIYGLETIQEQIDVFEAFSIKEQVTLLRETLSNLEDLPDLFEKLHTLYLKRDLEGMAKLSDEHTQESENSELLERLNDRLLTKRNLRMLERMLPRLEAGNTFVAVGALHLVGSQGLLKLLEAKGYRVTALY